jgi:hypothetical protein
VLEYPETVFGMCETWEPVEPAPTEASAPASGLIWSMPTVIEIPYTPDLRQLYRETDTAVPREQDRWLAALGFLD